MYREMKKEDRKEGERYREEETEKDERTYMLVDGKRRENTGLRGREKWRNGEKVAKR